MSFVLANLKYIAGALLLAAIAFAWIHHGNSRYKEGIEHEHSLCLAAAQKEVNEAREAVNNEHTKAENEKIAARQEREQNMQRELYWQQQEANRNQQSLDKIRRHFEDSLKAKDCSRWQSEVVPCAVD